MFSVKFKVKEPNIKTISTDEKKEQVKTVNVLLDDSPHNINLEEYVVGVVACEMPASFNLEALKAMSVASRTYALNKLYYNPNYILKTNVSDQCYISYESMKDKWKENFEKYYQKIKEATELTKGEYLEYQEKPIKAFYFSTSNGYTENVEDVFLEKEDYLISVLSPWDVNIKGFEQSQSFTEEEFLKLLNLKDTKVNNIKITDLTDSNRVKSIYINDVKFSGINFRQLLNLRSTDFNIEKNNNNITVTTKGYGHGVGMSQYGANGMANEGKNYQDILKYYYKNVEIKSV